MSGPVLLVADKDQKIFDLPGYLACGQSGPTVAALFCADLIPLPPGSNLFFLPDRTPLAFNNERNVVQEVKGFSPVAAFIPPGYTQLATAAYVERKGFKILPLFSYAPVAFYRKAFYVPAVRVDTRPNHDITALDRDLLARQIRAFNGTSNRLIKHLADCAWVNSCPNAINFFFGKYECPLPVSPSCNASCLGCISWQKKGSCAATQPRLSFVPSADEIAEVALRHIRAVKDAVVSFGQGCEGEPLMAAGVIKDAIILIRRQTSRGTIHMNTNAGRTRDIADLCRSGLDSIRVSLNSARAEYYQRYYAPRGYAFSDVCASMAEARRQKKFVALNYLVMPGFTDAPDEYAAFSALVRRTGVNMVQWRNLNFDPQVYFRKMRAPVAGLLGMKTVLARMRASFPALRHGYFNVAKGQWRQ
ncbi:MAG: radical SAM protein [Candidatus Omnitrophica bacterium]|nr:radical SAM protein [Candidatus Omnitrophota bacterium]